MIGVTLETARLGVVRSRRVARFAVCYAWNQDVARFCAGQRFGMAAFTREASVRGVIESRVRQPPLRGVSIGNCRNQPG